MRRRRMRASLAVRVPRKPAWSSSSRWGRSWRNRISKCLRNCRILVWPRLIWDRIRSSLSRLLIIVIRMAAIGALLIAREARSFWRRRSIALRRPILETCPNLRMLRRREAATPSLETTCSSRTRRPQQLCPRSEVALDRIRPARYRRSQLWLPVIRISWWWKNLAWKGKEYSLRAIRFWIPRWWRSPLPKSAISSCLMSWSTAYLRRIADPRWMVQPSGRRLRSRRAVRRLLSIKWYQTIKRQT